MIVVVILVFFMAGVVVGATFPKDIQRALDSIKEMFKKK